MCKEFPRSIASRAFFMQKDTAQSCTKILLFGGLPENKRKNNASCTKNKSKM